MTEAEGLALVLASLYLLECAVWVPRSALVLRFSGWGRAQPVPAPSWAGSAHKLPVFGNPLPPLGALIVTAPPAAAIAPEGVTPLVADTDDPCTAAGPLIRWEDVAGVTVADDRVLLDGTEFVRAASGDEAHALAARIADVAAVTPDRREEAALAALDAAFDSSAVDERLAEWKRARRMLGGSTNFVWTVLVVLVLTLFGTPWLAPRWPWVIAFLLAAVVVALLDFARAHRALYPDARGRRWITIVTCALFAPGAARVGTALSRDLLAGFHPLAAARGCCDDLAFRRLAGGALARLHHPRGDAPDAPPSLAWYRARLLERAEACVEGAGVAVQELLGPPTPSSSAVQGFCPRCRAEYERMPGACADCGGLAIVKA